MTVKIIGKFSETDGEEFGDIGALIEAKGLIGSLSDDVGKVELFYDNDGNTYAVAHNSEEYYGLKENREPEKTAGIGAGVAIVAANIIGATLLLYGAKKLGERGKKVL